MVLCSYHFLKIVYIFLQTKRCVFELLSAVMLLHKLINNGIYLFLSRRFVSVCGVENLHITAADTATFILRRTFDPGPGTRSDAKIVSGTYCE
jgi:hypothetical protein